MRLEDTIKHRLFRTSNNQYTRRNIGDFVIECKADIDKPVPLCIPTKVFDDTALVYKQLYLSNSRCQERSAPRSMYNLMFSNYYPNDCLNKVKIKDCTYYASQGVLFNADKQILFYFAQDLSDMMHPEPWLYITPRLLVDATVSGKPMEKFFMSTIVPYVLRDTVYVGSLEKHITIEIDNHADDTFFMPSSTLVSHTPVDEINIVLNNILFNNANVLSRFTENYRNR